MGSNIWHYTCENHLLNSCVVGVKSSFAQIYFLECAVFAHFWQHFEIITNWDLLVLIHLLNIRSVRSSAMNTWQAEVMLIYELMTRPEIHLSKEERDRVVRNWRTVGRLNLNKNNNMWNELSSGEFFFQLCCFLFPLFYNFYHKIYVVWYGKWFTASRVFLIVIITIFSTIHSKVFVQYG